MEVGGKKINALNVVSAKEHKGFGAGAIDLNNVSAVIIDGDDAYIDLGALHAKSKVERGIKFSPNKDDVPNGRKCWIVWVAVDKKEEGAYYAGATACEMLVDPEARRGWKILADHVNKMDYAMKRRIILDGLSEGEKAALKRCLIEYNEGMWEASSDELKEKLS
ncbi:MAG TPA: YwhD family protein [Paenibacillus sp.]|nr:YwhD family protein [Paenibacillus sp.]